MSSARARLLRIGVLVAATALVSCGAPPQQEESVTAVPVMGGGGAAGGANVFEIVVLGDSLTSGLGLLSDQAFPAVVESRFRGEGYASVTIVNAGISGDTTAGGLRRVEQVLTPNTRVLVVALGGNDALRGLTVRQTRDNLAGIIDVALDRQVAVLLAGMEAPTNLGEDYRTAFREVFTTLLSDYRGRINLLPFLLEGVAGVPALNQTDGIHPNAEGARRVADLVYPRLRTMVDAMGGGL